MSEHFREVIAVVPAAGTGSRMQAQCPKQYLTIGDKTILEHAVSALLRHRRVSKVIVAISPEDTRFDALALAKHPQVLKVTGGAQRADSVLAGLNAAGNADWVLVHDAARPCLHPDDLCTPAGYCRSQRGWRHTGKRQCAIP
jgi:2-C-methyl-D-erythritol 4-phosphate cytidylyltransferase